MTWAFQTTKWCISTLRYDCFSKTSLLFTFFPSWASLPPLQNTTLLEGLYFEDRPPANLQNVYGRPQCHSENKIFMSSLRKISCGLKGILSTDRQARIINFRKGKSQRDVEHDMLPTIMAASQLHDDVIL